MNIQSHERLEFTQAVTYTVAITITVEGGRAQGTADRRAAHVAERLANTAVRTPGVVEVTATAGPSRDGTAVSPTTVHFSEANAGRRGLEGDEYLDRFVDPDHEVALRSLAHAKAAAQRPQSLECQQERPDPSGLELEL